MITSTSNKRIKSIRKLRDRKERHASGLFFVEGIRIVAEAVDAEKSGHNSCIDTLIVSYDFLKSAYGRGLIEEAAERGSPILEVSGDVFQNIAMKDNPQGLAAVVNQDWSCLDDIGNIGESFKGSGSWIALDAVQNPGNLGTILRTHDAVGGSGVILLDHTVDPYDPTAVRASMGAVLSQRLIQVPLSVFSEWKMQFGYPVIGTSGEAKMDYQEMDYPASLILLMGSEREGLQAKHLRLCDSIVKIPMVGKSDSLNLAVATAVVLYEIFNQHRCKFNK